MTVRGVTQDLFSVTSEAAGIDEAVDRGELRADSAQRALRDYDLVAARLRTAKGVLAVCYISRGTAAAFNVTVTAVEVEEWDAPYPL
jgi:hypothetical protein